MTERFKDFMLELSWFILLVLAMILYIPTLGHSGQWVDKYSDYLRRTRPQTFGKD